MDRATRDDDNDDDPAPGIYNVRYKAKPKKVGATQRPALRDLRRLDARIRAKASEVPPPKGTARRVGRLRLLEERVRAKETSALAKNQERDRRNWTELRVTGDRRSSGLPEVFMSSVQECNGFPRTREHKRTGRDAPKPVPRDNMDRSCNTNCPDIERGGEENNEGLAVAVAVSPEPVGVSIPQATDYDPQEAVRQDKMRRCRIYSIAASVLLIISLTVGLVVGTQKNQRAPSTPFPVLTLAPTLMPTRGTVQEQVQNLVGDKIFEVGTPNQRAFEWLTEVDPLELDRNGPFVAQRYFLALLYFSTNSDGWWSCEPSDGEAECDAVVLDLDGNPYNGTFSRWLSADHECDWYGVDCAGDDQFVRSIEIARNNLNGTLPAELAELPFLMRLSFIDNALTGTIPTEYGSMEHLLDIQFQYNSLTGSIPDEMYNSKNLERLNLGYNFLTGTMSSKIGNLRKLKDLFTFDNKFNGTIPSQVGEMIHLVHIGMEHNFHTGTVPTELGKLQRLRELYLNGNDITGSLPSEVGVLGSLEKLIIHTNFFSGALPDELYNLESLIRFYGSNNLLNGTFSPKVENLKNIKDLLLHRNHFTGTIPAEISGLPSISKIYMHFNRFTGDVSDRFCGLTEEFYADCGPTNKTGVPAVVCDCCTHCCDPVQESCSENG